MGRRVLMVESGCELVSLVSEGVAAVDPGIEVDHARTVDAAVERLSTGGYDLIVSDEALDGTRAGLFLRHLCERRFPTIPFVLLSDGDPDELGADDECTWLEKPFSARECSERIKRLL